MQLSQLFRRGIVRPLDDNAAQQLSQFAVRSPVRVEWLPILGDEQFAEIWEAGVLQRINRACGTEISDYEEVALPIESIQDAIVALHSDTGTKGSTAQFCEQLDLLLSGAKAAMQSVYFVL